MSKNPTLAVAIIQAAQRGAATLPVSVKIRLGYVTNDLETWLPALLEAQPAVVTIHARTRQEMSKVPAHWEAVARAVAIRNALGSMTCIVGNGDMKDIAMASLQARQSGVDGVMLGRAIFGNPWLFNGCCPRFQLAGSERLRVMVEHAALFAQLFNGRKSFDVMKKHFKAYVSGLDRAQELAMRLMATGSVTEVAAVVEQYQCALLSRP